MAVTSVLRCKVTTCGNFSTLYRNVAQPQISSNSETSSEFEVASARPLTRLTNQVKLTTVNKARTLRQKKLKIEPRIANIDSSQYNTEWLTQRKMAEQNLIKRCQNGDRAAFDVLLERHYDTIYRFAFRWCNDQSNAQDITQQACLKLARAIHQYDFKSTFTSWLYPLVINTAKDFYKSPNQVERHPTLDNESPQADRNEQRHYAQQILEFINTLPNELKDTLLLVFGKGLNHAQAANELGIKESTVSWRIHEARKQLKISFTSSTLNDNSVESLGGSA